ncbi:hypothetical protein [Schleiferia thermophila]|jgi:hypothetical protein|uniref:Outer membrane protein with beta-barrel domain n=1 Tax=Schleiferia thermophila TaxID=884107 RepID=A0A369A225_9FLAO|nr:hypothetical protein [Schleiferia thermophila]RCX03241.1 hypothetical protein DES35_103122 [Schleiferia thermophila]GCD80369.1 hypothetical protein JCM30197_16160 [Schleiferia thermophila]
MKYALFILFVGLGTMTFGQTTVLKKPKSVFDEDYSYGKNRKHYVHSGFSILGGISADQLPDLEFSAFNSGAFQFFILYKYKLNNIFSLTSEFAFGGTGIVYTYKGSLPLYPSVFSEHRSDIINRGEIELRQNLRIRFGGGPNRIGTYLEGGVLGGFATTNDYIHRGVSIYNTRMEMKFINESVILADGNSYRIHRWYYGFRGRFGFNRWSLPVQVVRAGSVNWVLAGIEFSFL